MRTSIVITCTGTDRIGIVEEVTRALLSLGGNIGTSRMAHLGGEFTMLMLVSLPTENLSHLQDAFMNLTAQGYKITTTETSAPDRYTGWPEYRVTVTGADHEGIIHEIAAGFSASGITIESAETDVTEAPFSGTPLFSMEALVLVPPVCVESGWIDELMGSAEAADLEIKISLEK